MRDELIEVNIFSLQKLPLVPNPARIESKLERVMLDLLVLEDAHYKLRYVQKIIIIFSHDSTYGMNSYRISKYTPKLVAGLSMDDFAFGPSKLGAHYEVNIRIRKIK